MSATTDQRLLSLVVTMLGVALFIALGGVIYLTSVDRGAPDVLVLVAGGCVTALAAVLPGARAAARTSDPAGPPPPLAPPVAPAIEQGPAPD